MVEEIDQQQQNQEYYIIEEEIIEYEIIWIMSPNDGNSSDNPNVDNSKVKSLNTERERFCKFII